MGGQTKAYHANYHHSKVDCTTQKLIAPLKSCACNQLLYLEPLTSTKLHMVQILILFSFISYRYIYYFYWVWAKNELGIDIL